MATACAAVVCVCMTQTASSRDEWIALWMMNPAGLTGHSERPTMFPSVSILTRFDAVTSSYRRP